MARSVSSRPWRRRLLFFGTPLLLVVLLGGFATWYFLFRDDAPPAVDIQAASEAASDSAGAGSGSGSGETTTSLSGAWSVDTEVGDFADFTSSFAGYRVQEELVSIGAKTAVGRTPDVTGTLTFDGTTLNAAAFEVNTTTLQSDDDRRDNSIRNQALETSRYPTATFSLTQPIEIDSIPADGETVQLDAVGELTLHGVTREVTFPLEAAIEGDVIVVTGSLDVPFADFDIEPPTSMSVLSVEDHGVIEVQLFFSRATTP